MKQPIKVSPPIRLKDFNPAFRDGREKEATLEETEKLCARIGELQKRLYANADHSLIILLQGMDTSGKDGTVRRVLDCVNPSGVETANFKAPSSEELAHDFLWRIHKAVPRYGNIGIFNRSQYEDVLIVRVFGMVPEKVCQERFKQINAFEKNLAENRVILLKFFLHISKEEQAKRLKARLEDPQKNWKFESGDLEMRKRWREFEAAYEDVLNKCSTKHSPWHIVPADNKWYRNYVVARTVVKALEKLKLKWPKPREDLSKIRIR